MSCFYIDKDCLNKVLCMNISNNYMQYRSYSAQPKKQNVKFGAWSPKGTEHLKKIEELKNLILNRDTQRIAVSGHVGPDGDCISSGFAMANIINKLTNKKVDFFVFGKIPERFNFLDTNKKINVISVDSPRFVDAEQLKQQHGKYDLAIAVDTASETMFSENYYNGIFRNARATAKIDHHPVKETINPKTNKPVNCNYADINIVDDSCNSATQLVMQLVEPFGLRPEQLSQTTNESLYTGLLTDTKNFAFAKNPQAFEDAYLLVKNGVNNVDMQHRIFGNVAPEAHKVHSHIDKLLQFTPDGKIAYFIEDDALWEMKKRASKEGYRDDLQAQMSTALHNITKLKGVEIVVHVNGSKFNIRSNNADISKLAVKYGGGGHKNAAGFQIEADPEDMPKIVKRIVNEYSTLLKEEG